jgi:hypothetical protein
MGNIPICFYIISENSNYLRYSFIPPYTLLLIITLGYTLACAWRIHKVLILSKHYRLYLQSTAPTNTFIGRNIFARFLRYYRHDSSDSQDGTENITHTHILRGRNWNKNRHRGVIELESSNMSFEYDDHPRTETINSIWDARSEVSVVDAGADRSERDRNVFSADLGPYVKAPSKGSAQNGNNGRTNNSTTVDESSDKPIKNKAVPAVGYTGFLSPLFTLSFMAATRNHAHDCSTHGLMNDVSLREESSFTRESRDSRSSHSGSSYFSFFKHNPYRDPALFSQSSAQALSSPNASMLLSANRPTSPTPNSTLIRPSRSNNSLLEPIMEGEQVISPVSRAHAKVDTSFHSGVKRTVSGGYSAERTTSRDTAVHTLANANAMRSASERGDEGIKPGSSDKLTKSGAPSEQVSTIKSASGEVNKNDKCHLSNGAVIIGDVDMDAPGICGIRVDNPKWTVLAHINTSTSSTQAEVLMEEVPASPSSNGLKGADGMENAIHLDTARLSMQYSAGGKPKSKGSRAEPRAQNGRPDETADRFVNAEDSDNYLALFVLSCKLFVTCGGVLDCCDLLPYLGGAKGENINTANAESEGGLTTMDLNGNSNRNDVLKSLNLLRAIWHFNGRSMMMVIAYGISNLIGLPTLIFALIVNYNHFLSRNNNFYDCLVAASLAAPNQTQTLVDSYASDVCGSIPNHEPSYIMVSGSCFEGFVSKFILNS